MDVIQTLGAILIAAGLTVCAAIDIHWRADHRVAYHSLARFCE